MSRSIVCSLGVWFEYGAFDPALDEEWIQLLESSISEACGKNASNVPNASNDTAPVEPVEPVEVVCGSVVTGVVEQGTSVADAYLTRHTFCTPEAEDIEGVNLLDIGAVRVDDGGGGVGKILFSTCGSSFQTGLTINGPNGFQRSCTGGSQD